LNIAVFVSGRGSNLRAIIDSNEPKNLVEVRVVCSNKSGCGAFDVAHQHNIPTYSISSEKIDGYINYEELLPILKEEKIELVVLAGYLKLIPPFFVREFPFKIINVHPALLPSFGGHGMYGIRVHQAVFDSSVKISGATVHFVNEEYDRGLIIAQNCVDILNVKSPEEIAAKVLEAEHELLPWVIKKIAQNKVEIVNNRVEIKE
jgi:formyltetrahydrofolate-dependent phosphoribosylglycinamide formyltransferase